MTLPTIHWWQHLRQRWHNYLLAIPRRTTPQASPIILKRRKIYIIPTRYGFWFASVLFVMLLGSMNYNNSMGYMLTFLLASMGMVTTLHTHRMLLGLRIEAGKVTPVFVGELAHFQIWIDNRGQATRYALTWEQTDFVQDKVAPLVIDVPANERISLMLAVPALQRGRLGLGKITVSSCFPLGLFYAWAYIFLDMNTLAYPSPAGQKTLPSGKQANQVGLGNHRGGSGEDFMGYRDYKPGDSPRHIDWKAVAREQGWLVKQFGGTEAVIVWFTWEDVSLFNNMETALSQLCLWIIMADSQGALYGLQIPGYTFEPNQGELHRQQCLTALALFQQ